MYRPSIFNIFSRIANHNILSPVRNISTTTTIYLNVTNVLFAEPLKRKKRLDPSIIRAREERKRRKIEKFIKRLEKHASQLKPIIENEIPRALMDELELRKRDLPPLSVEELEERALMFKEWTKYKSKEHKKTLEIIRVSIAKQDKALKALKEESEELYQEAIQICPDLLPFSTKGPVATPPIKDYDAPDGEYIDITRKYEGE